MENRISRTSSSRSATASEIDDALYPAYHHYRPGPSLAASTSLRRPVPSPARDNGQPNPENVFADPVDSPPPSPTGSAFYSNSVVTPTPSVRRPSLSLSARRSPSPLPGGANGGYYYQHHRLSQSLTPSIRSSASSTYGYGGGGGVGGGGGGLNRSNTTGTNGTGYSTLSSIPSNLSDFMSPPSPLPPVRPQWNYGGHQQNIYPDSVHTGSVVPEEDDPFADDFMIPVGDGFAPHHQRPQVAMVFPSSASSVGSVEPPPYTRYPKPEEVGTPLMQNGDSGIDVGLGLDEEARSRRAALEASGGAGLLRGADMIGGGGEGGEGGSGSGGGGGGGGGGDDDGSGANKEWRQKRVLGFRLPAIMAIALVVLLAVGLGVGLGVGLKDYSAAIVYPSHTITTLPPNSEESGPPLSSPNATYPLIPTGLALLSPLLLSDSDSSCGILAQDASAPNFFGQGSDLLWSCQFDQTQDVNAVTWRFEKFPVDQQVNMADFISQPPFLRGAEYGDGKWGAYQVSSAEGIQMWEDNTQLVKVIGNDIVVEYSGKSTWRDGTQNQPLWRIPFAFYNTTVSSTTLLPRHITTATTTASPARATTATSDYTSYKFGVLVDKIVIVKQSTIEANIASQSGTILTGNGTALIPGEIVWKCIWEKTLLEVELFVNDPSEGFSRESLRGSTNKSEADEQSHASQGASSPTGSLPVPHPMGTGDASSAFLSAQQTPGTSPSGNLSMTYKRNSHRKRTSVVGGGRVGPYPRRISIQESRPTTKRIRQVLGMDLTDPDPDGHADLGTVRCTQFIATADGGLTPFMDKVSGEGFVVLKEQSGPGMRKRGTHKRGTPGLVERTVYSDGYGGTVAARKEELRERDSNCFCRWSS